MLVKILAVVLFLAVSPPDCLDELDEAICVRLGFIDEIPKDEDGQAEDQPSKIEEIDEEADDSPSAAEMQGLEKSSVEDHDHGNQGNGSQDKTSTIAETVRADDDAEEYYVYEDDHGGAHEETSGKLEKHGIVAKDHDHGNQGNGSQDKTSTIAETVRADDDAEEYYVYEDDHGGAHEETSGKLEKHGIVAKDESVNGGEGVGEKRKLPQDSSKQDRDIKTVKLEHHEADATEYEEYYVYEDANNET
ncbi:hypothetical protein CSKR_110924 [Clonorchis sinensis]|uniref:Uncharacterized protein n=1 Tax=Clonorchis sinensis TaxID=79923 RepID=A0A8T1MJU6_CLOSI|nr:hypothetical protein CSKR_110924 [Clonorchis sinensis]